MTPMEQNDSGFLTDAEIRERSSRLFREGYVEKLAVHASYDLRLGEDVYLSGSDYPLKLTPGQPFVSIPRGQFALLMTKEYLTLPRDYLGFISIKFGVKAQGLINVSGFHVDPGFEGRVVFSVFNAGPMDVVLEYDKATFMIFFYKLRSPVEQPYEGERKRQEHLPTELVTSLKGVSASLAQVDRRLSLLETSSKIWWALLLAVIGALIALFIRGIVGT